MTSPERRCSSGASLLVLSVTAPVFLSLSCLFVPWIYSLVQALFERLYYPRRMTDTGHNSQSLPQTVPVTSTQEKIGRTPWMSAGLW